MIGSDGIIEKIALLRAASFISWSVMFSSFPRLNATIIKITGWRRTIRMVIPQRIAIVVLFANCRCVLIVIPPYV